MNIIKRIKSNTADKKKQPQVTRSFFQRYYFVFVLIEKIEAEKWYQKAMRPTGVVKPFGNNFIYRQYGGEGSPFLDMPVYSNPDMSLNEGVEWCFGSGGALLGFVHELKQFCSSLVEKFGGLIGV